MFVKFMLNVDTTDSQIVLDVATLAQAKLQNVLSSEFNKVPFEIKETLIQFDTSVLGLGEYDRSLDAIQDLLGVLPVEVDFTWRTY